MKIPFLIKLVLAIQIILPSLALADTHQSSNLALEPRELVFLNWDDYIDPELIQEFEHKFNARVKQIHFENDDARDEMMIQNEGQGYDLVMVNGVQMGIYRQRGWLAPISEAKVPNLRHLDPRWISAYDTQDYGVPYFWGSLGIAYRSDLVPEAITSWMQLYRPAKALQGKIAMIRVSRDLIGMALKALGHSANSVDHQELAAAKALLLAQKPYVRDYSYDSLEEDSALVTGKIAAAMMYSGDALMLQDYNPHIVFVLPQEGGNLWVDYLTVMASSQNKGLAMEFINFLNKPENAARQAILLNYPTPNKAAERFLPEDFLANPLIYPTQDRLQKSEFSRELPPHALRRFNSIFTSVVQ